GSDAYVSSFLLNREQIIEKIKDSGREPNVAGGGFLETRTVDLKIDYPAVFVKCDGGIYSSEFKTTHSNLGLDGVTGVDDKRNRYGKTCDSNAN
ncbi:hypothetical protein, partial [Piscirickettsia salmonis]|uniref:hypothetical protein n=1 Tax=Piscirickettsia salmonis TaxID=1238 RepID=UPI00053C02ED